MSSEPTKDNKPKRGQPCPCGSGQLFEACCEPALQGTRPAPTAEALMRSRFTAHVANDQAYLHRTYKGTASTPFVAEPDETPIGWTRLVVEKPFGSDLQSALKLNALVHRHFDERQVYRVLVDVLAVPEQGMSLAAVLKEAGLVASNGEGNRMIDQKAVKIDQQRVEDRGTMLKAGGEHLLQVGPRRYARVSLKPL